MARWEGYETRMEGSGMRAGGGGGKREGVSVYISFGEGGLSCLHGESE